MASLRDQEIARRYAAALLSLADEQGQITQVSEDVERLKAIFSDVPEFSTVINNAMLDNAMKKQAVLSAVQAAGCAELTQKFLSVMADNQRLMALPQVLVVVEEGIAQRQGIVTAHVTTARGLSAGQSDAIVSALSSSLGKSVALEVQIDPALIGGLVVRVGSKMIDGSVKNKLDRLTRLLTANDPSQTQTLQEKQK